MTRSQFSRVEVVARAREIYDIRKLARTGRLTWGEALTIAYREAEAEAAFRAREAQREAAYA